MRQLIMATLFSSILSLFGCVQTDSSAAAVKSMLTNGEYTIIDVRTPEEFAAGHNEGAVNLPIQDINTWADTLLPYSRNIILVCRSGGRAGRAKHTLDSIGYVNTVNGGGWDAFEKTLKKYGSK
jgi:phage shock protein E